MRSSGVMLLRIVFLALLWALSTTTAYSDNTGPSLQAQEKARVANLQCFACHQQEALTHPPKEGLDLAKLRHAVVDPSAFKGSDHGKLACTKCHTEGYDDYPHAADAKDNTGACADCHQKKADKIEGEFAKSVHAKRLADKFTCNTCHNPHVMRTAANQTDAGKIVAQDNHICLSCHDSDETFAKYAPEKKSRPLIDDIHAWLPNTRLHWSSVRCIECHTPLSSDTQSHEIVAKDRAERNCATCHTANSQLNMRLYRYLAKDEHNKLGFLNSVFLGKSYVLGATRNLWLDRILIALMVATILGVLVHGAIRIISTLLRRRK